MTDTITPVRTGDIVLYTLSKNDCDTILQARQTAGQGTKRGNTPRPGDELPAIVVKTWNPRNVNLQVFLDGDDTLWAQSRSRLDPNVHGRWTGYDDPQEESTWLLEPQGHWVAR